MEEASVLGNRIGILSGGQIKCIGSPIFLINRYGRNISLTLVKKSLKNTGLDENKVNKDIIDFVIKSYNTYSGKKLELHEDNMEVEVLSEEILIRLPKNENNDKHSVDSKISSKVVQSSKSSDTKISLLKNEENENEENEYISVLTFEKNNK